MSRQSIVASGLGKDFNIYSKPSDRMLELLTRRPRHRTFRALDKIDLTVLSGETVGIVGRNGSGKSTLLQLIAGVLRPTRGRVDVKGRVAALLELGSGFGPDFTGRENVFLNAQIIGLRRHEIEERFERIEKFADIGDFIDQPVRTYSSGMLVRLAFAVSVNSDPDILIIDEALAVGDEAFQRKCFSKIEEIKASGTTILFVSHAASSVVRLCDRAMLIDGGACLLIGRPKDVVSRYQKFVNAPDDRREELRQEIISFGKNIAQDCDHQEAIISNPLVGEAINEDFSIYPEIKLDPFAVSERFDHGLNSESVVDYISTGARIFDLRILSTQERVVNILIPGQIYVLKYRVAFDCVARFVEFGMVIKSIDGIVLFGQSSHGHSGFIAEVAANTVVEVEFRFRTHLRPGTYFLTVGCQGVPEGRDERCFLHRILDVSCFKIEGGLTDRFTDGFYDLSEEPACKMTMLDTGFFDGRQVV